MPVRRGPVQQAVRRDLERLGKTDQSSALAMTALTLAELLDTTSALEARDAAALARELRATLAALPRPVKGQEDTVDEISARRVARRNIEQAERDATG